jgi:hypothetical protein
MGQENKTQLTVLIVRNSYIAYNSPTYIFYIAHLTQVLYVVSNSLLFVFTRLIFFGGKPNTKCHYNRHIF